ncbi:MAG TPA: NADH-ubiquinone oxidoreductase-F iron-sulfur binding region domain-containing protein [Polyangiaceae bacterium]|nr:NADH-ubiquinone oxidoreductase-F iron-sulfur binding region domain-containing protein [Polyangiaceae bacterium]
MESFYDYLHGAATPHRTCTGSACQFARSEPASGATVHCLGRCYEAPASTASPPTRVPRRSLVERPVVLRHLLEGVRADPALQYASLPSGDEILAAVERAGLRGRGGAAFPTATKWRIARDTPAPERYVIANGDEGDPGAYIDRLLLEEDPHSVLAGMVACARAIGARRGIVFIRREYDGARRMMIDAVDRAEHEGWLGSLQVAVVSGAGSYVAGEESALLRAIEGLRAEPHPKPPYPAERGLTGLPTVIQNVETLSVVPWVVQTRERANTKVVCLSGAVARPGAVEIALGTPLAEVLERGGGGAATARSLSMALIGGPMGRVLPASRFDTPLSFDVLPGLGHAGIVVFDTSVSARALAQHLFAFAASESCGSCTPCRVGTARLAQRRDRPALERLLETLELGSLCGFGQAVPRPIRDLLEHFPQEMFPC